MALLSQALHLGYLLSPHSAFQGHAAHTARWPGKLSSKGSSDTCISAGVFHIPMPCFTAHGPVMVRDPVAIIAINAPDRDRGTHYIFGHVARQTLILRRDVALLDVT